MGDVHSGQKIDQVAVDDIELLVAILQLLVERRQLFVGRLQLFLGSLQLLVRTLQLLVAGLSLLVRRAKLLVHRLLLFDDRLQILARGFELALEARKLAPAVRLALARLALFSEPALRRRGFLDRLRNFFEDDEMETFLNEPSEAAPERITPTARLP